MNKEKIQLQLKIIEGKKYIVDQHGRVLEGVSYFMSTSEVGEVDELTIRVVQYQDGDIIISGGHS